MKLNLMAISFFCILLALAGCYEEKNMDIKISLGCVP